MKQFIIGNREDLLEKCYICGFGILTLMKALGMQDGDLDYKILLIIGMLFLLVKICISTNSMKEWGVVVIFICLGGIAYIQTGDKGLLIYIVIMLGMKNVDLKKVMMTGAIIWIAGISVMTVLTLSGVVAEITTPNKRPIIGEVLRHDLGYGHPNTLGLAVVTAVMYAGYSLVMKAKKRKAVYALGVLTIWGGLYFFLSYSFTSMLLIALFAVLLLYSIYHERLSKTARIIAYLILSICLVISYVLPFAIYGTNGFTFTRTILHYFLSLGDRFQLSLNAMTQWPISPFGQRVTFITDGVEWNVVDNSYVWILVQAGWFPTAVLLILFEYVIITYIHHNRIPELAIAITLLVAGISEPLLFNTSCKNIIFLFAGECIWHNQWKNTHLSLKAK